MDGSLEIRGSAAYRRFLAGDPFHAAGGRHSCTLVYSPDNQLVAASGTMGQGLWRILILDANTGERVDVFEPKYQWVSAMAFSKDGRRLAWAGWEGRLEIWDLKIRRRQELSGQHSA